MPAHLHSAFNPHRSQPKDPDVSYSFNIKAPTKAELSEKFDNALNSIVHGQPVHARDRKAIDDLGEAFIALLPETIAAHQQYEMNCYGSVSGEWSHAGLDRLTSVQCNCTVSVGTAI